MALDQHIFTPGAAPDHSSALTQIALKRPDVFKAFSEGYDQAQKRQIQLQEYRQAKIKADLAEALYPQQSALQQAMLLKRMEALNKPTDYNVNSSAISPISTAPAKVAVTNNEGVTTTVQPGTGLPPTVYRNYAGDNPLQLKTPNATFPGAASTDLGALPFTPQPSYQTGNPLSDTTDSSVNPFGESVPDIPA